MYEPKRTWCYPESIKRLTNWLPIKSIKALTKIGVTDYKANNKRMFVQQGDAAVQVLLERRLSVEGEIGKYQYRLVSFIETRQHIEALQQQGALQDQNYDDVELSLEFKKVGVLRLPVWSIKCVYDENAIALFDNLFSVWQDNRILIPWLFTDELFTHLNDLYCLDKEYRPLSVTLALNRAEQWAQHASLNAFGKYVVFLKCNVPNHITLARDVEVDAMWFDAHEPVVTIHNVRSTLFDRDKHLWADSIIDVQSTRQAQKNNRHIQVVFDDHFQRTPFMIHDLRRAVSHDH